MKLFYRSAHKDDPPNQHVSAGTLEDLSAIEASEAAEHWFLALDSKGYATDSGYVIVPDFEEMESKS